MAISVKRIEVNTDILSASTAEVASDIGNIRNRIDKTFDGIQVLNGMWDGFANDEFNRQFLLDYERLNEICSELDSFASKMSDAVKKYNDGEDRVAAAVAAIRF